MTDLLIAESQPCQDTECPGRAEPEQDGSLQYYACTVCGYEFGYQQATIDAACAIGVPEDVRRRASQAPVGPVLVQIGRRPPHA